MPPETGAFLVCVIPRKQFCIPMINLHNRFRYLHHTKSAKMKFSLNLILSLLVLMSSCKKDNPVDTTVPPTLPPGNAPIQNLYLDITHDTTLTNINPGTDYLLANCIRILNGATLTIEKGVTIEVVQDGCIEIHDNSALRVNGTKTDSVVFTAQYFPGVLKTKGFWRGLYYYQTTNPNNRLSHCTIEYAGSETVYTDKKSAINLYGSSIELDTCNIQKNKYWGLYVDRTSTPFGIHGCAFIKNDAEPVYVYHTNCDVLTGDNYFAQNQINQVYVKTVSAYNTDRPITLRKLSIPYAFSDVVRFGEPLTLEPGVRIHMQTNAILFFDNTVSANAKLIAVGTPSDSIKIIGAVADSGFWFGIGFYKGGDCHLEYCRLSDAGAYDVYGYTPLGMISFYSDSISPGGNINIVHSTIAMCSHNGLVIDTPYFNFNPDIETSNFFDYVNGIDVVYF